MEVSNLKEIQSQIGKCISRMEDLEMENKYLRQHKEMTEQLLLSNVKVMDDRYQKLFKKYMRCLFKYGMYQSCLNHMISAYNKLQPEKYTLEYCLERFGVVYEKDRIIEAPQMDLIISDRLRKESEEIHNIFFGHAQTEVKVHTLQRDENTSTDEETQPSTQQYSRFLSEEIINGNPKTIKIDQLLQLNQNSRDTSSQITERSKLPSRHSHDSPQEDRLRSYDKTHNSRRYSRGKF